MAHMTVYKKLYLLVLTAIIIWLVFMFGYVEIKKKDELFYTKKKLINREGAKLSTKNITENARSFSLYRAYPRLIIYNRVPKTGSTFIKYLFHKLKTLNRWTFTSSKIFDRFVLNYTMQDQLVKQMTALTKSRVYERHFHWINFTKFNADVPVYINIVRDPLDRLVSSYYFLRNNLRHIYKNVNKESYDACVQNRRDNCIGDDYKGYFAIIPFFCGQHPQCRKDSDFALNCAKKNLLQHYALVGLTEDLYSFTRVLEFKFPSYFKGMTSLFNRTGSHMRKRFGTKRKILPQESTIRLMKKKLFREYDFYSLVKQHFYNTVRKLNSLDSVQ